MSANTSNNVSQDAHLKIFVLKRNSLFAHVYGEDSTVPSGRAVGQQGMALTPAYRNTLQGALGNGRKTGDG